MTLLKIAAVVMMFAVPANMAIAQDLEGFQSPTGNIMCLYFDDGGASSVRCDIGQISINPPAPPADCELDWGNAFELGENSRRAARICHGDTVAGDYPVLRYGESWQRGLITCHSARTGMMCRNARGAGFELSRAKQRVF